LPWFDEHFRDVIYQSGAISTAASCDGARNFGFMFPAAAIQFCLQLRAR